MAPRLSYASDELMAQQGMAAVKRKKRYLLVLFDIATLPGIDPELRDQARTSLDLLFGWNNFIVNKHSVNAQMVGRLLASNLKPQAPHRC